MFRQENSNQFFETNTVKSPLLKGGEVRFFILKLLIMATEDLPFSGAPKNRVYRDQIVTTEDLLDFKAELLDEIGKLLNQFNAEPSKKWLKSPEVRKLLGISPGTLQNLRVNGSLPYTKIGGVLFYDFDDIRKMLQANRIQNGFSSQLHPDRPPKQRRNEV